MSKRVFIAGFALVGAIVAARLGAYQLGLLPVPWEPFFGDGARRVLDAVA